MAHEDIIENFLTLTIVLCLWLISVTLSRLYLSPLATIPGPKLAALTSWYEFYYDVILPGRYVFKIQELHSQYGPIIRIAPSELHINDPSFLDTIYPTSNNHVRDKDWNQTRGLNVGESTSGTISHELHRRRREALSPFFTQKNIVTLEPLIKGKVAQLCGHLDAAIVSETPVNLYDLYYAFARDVVYQYSFCKPSNVLGNAQEAASLRKNLTQLLRGVKVSKHFHFLFQGIRVLPLRLSRHIIPAGVKNMAELAVKIRGEIVEVLADKNNARETEHRSIFYELRDNPDLPSSEKSAARLQSEGTMLVMAGTESTAKTLGVLTYHLLANPGLLRTLRSELHTIPTFPTPTYTTFLHLPFLTATIHESLRLTFGLTGRNARKSPHTPLYYATHTIPPNTPISMTTLCIHTAPHLFPNPWAFKPERWLGQNGKKLQKYLYGFGRGARRCLGEQLAMAEVIYVIKAIVGYEMELWETGSEDVEFRHDWQVAHARQGSNGIRVMVKGKGERAERLELR